MKGIVQLIRSLVLSALFLCAGVARGQIDVPLPTGMQQINPLDSLSSRYDQRIPEVLASIGVEDTGIGYNDVLGTQALGDWTGRPESLGLRMYRSDFRWQFSVEAFGRQIAMLKSLARWSLSSAEIKSSLRFVLDTRGHAPSTFPNQSRYVDSLSVGDLRFPDLDDPHVRQHLLKLINESYGAPVLRSSSSSNRSHERLAIRYCADTDGANCAGEPVVVWPLRPWLDRNLAIHAAFVIPIRQGGSQALVVVSAYTGELMQMTDRAVDLDTATWPTATLSDAREAVEARAGDETVAAIYTNALGYRALVIAVLTASNRVFLVEPFSDGVW